MKNRKFIYIINNFLFTMIIRKILIKFIIKIYNQKLSIRE